MDLDHVGFILNELLSRKRPKSLNSSWILKHAPECYRFICKNIRTDLGSIDWDRVTYCLDRQYQRLWVPGRRMNNARRYENPDEVDRVLNRYRDQLYVFIAPADANDRRTRDIISICLVRVAQNGNVSAKRELVTLIGYTIDDWLERDSFLARWLGYKDELGEQLEGCIHRYRYTGSFIYYVYRTLHYVARGLRPPHAYSLDEPLFNGGGRRVDLLAGNPVSDTMWIYEWGSSAKIPSVATLRFFRTDIRDHSSQNRLRSPRGSLGQLIPGGLRVTTLRTRPVYGPEMGGNTN